MAGVSIQNWTAPFDESTNVNAINSREIAQISLNAQPDELAYIQVDYRDSNDRDKTFSLPGNPFGFFPEPNPDVNARIIIDKGEYVKTVRLRECTVGPNPQHRRIGWFEVVTSNGRKFGPYSTGLPTDQPTRPDRCLATQEFTATPGNIIVAFYGTAATVRPYIEGLGVAYCPEP